MSETKREHMDRMDPANVCMEGTSSSANSMVHPGKSPAMSSSGLYFILQYHCPLDITRPYHYDDDDESFFS